MLSRRGVNVPAIADDGRLDFCRITIAGDCDGVGAMMVQRCTEIRIRVKSWLIWTRLIMSVLLT